MAKNYHAPVDKELEPKERITGAFYIINGEFLSFKQIVEIFIIEQAK